MVVNCGVWQCVVECSNVWWCVNTLNGCGGVLWCLVKGGGVWCYMMVCGGVC